MMTLTRISEAILAEAEELPAMGEVMYQYVVAGNGLFIRAEDSRMQALVPIAPARLNGLAELAPYAELKVERVPGVWLRSVLASVRKHIPAEAMYQFWFDGAWGEQKPAVQRTWRCSMPQQMQSAAAVTYNDLGHASIDLHSHNSMAAFFSTMDDADEQGLRFYAVVGRIDTDRPEIRVRIGVYGHHMDVPADTIFDDLGPFVDQLLVDSSQASDDDDGDRKCQVCGCTDADGCENGCSGWTMICAAIASTWKQKANWRGLCSRR